MRKLEASFLRRITTIKKLPIFSALSLIQLQRVARSGELVVYKKGEMVCRKGDPKDFAYFLISGRLRSYTVDPYGEMENIEFIHKGMIFGLISALTGENHSETFEAINDPVVFRISSEVLHELLKKIPGLGVRFSKILSQRLRNRVTKTPNQDRSTIISVYAPASGSGGSTYALNLALSLFQETKDRVVFISIRPIHSLGEPVANDFDEVRPKWALPAQDIRTFKDDPGTVLHAVAKSSLGIDLLSATFDPLDTSLGFDISELITHFINEYRYIVVDLPSGMDDAALKTLSQSDLVHLVMLRRSEPLEAGRKVLRRLENSLKDVFHEDRIKIVISGVKAQRVPEARIKRLLKYKDIIFMPHIEHKDLAMFVESPEIAFWGMQEDCSYWKMLSRLTRQIAGVSVGLVLGGGAAFGLAHIGVLKILEKEGVTIDHVVGSSMGALIGGLWACGYSVQEIERFALEFRKKSNVLKLIDMVFPVSGLISGKAVTTWLKNRYGDRTFRDTRIPLKVVAYDLIHRRDVVIDKGSLVDAVRKSISIPGVFQPIVSGDQIIIDGGVMNPLPTNVLRDIGVKRIIAVNVLQSPDDVIRGYEKAQRVFERALAVPFLSNPWHFLETRVAFWLNKRFYPNITDIMVRTLEASEAVIAEKSAGLANVIIHPDLSGLEWFELYKAEELIARGEMAARAQINEIKSINERK